MTAQPTLFPVGRVRASDPDTSHTAAQGISGRTERLILHIFYDHDVTWTDDEIADVLALSYQTHAPTVKSARSRLSKAGLLVDTGQRRPSNRGRDQTVWALNQGAGLCAPSSSESRS